MKRSVSIIALLLFVVMSAFSQSGRGKLTAAELFFDTDPGFGNGVALTFNPGIDSSFRAAVHSLSSSLSPGLHTVNVRLRDSLSNWGPVFKTTLIVENALTARNIGCIIARAYWDNNTAIAQPLIILNGNASNALNTFINSSSLYTFSTPGLHKLSVQVMGVDGNYGASYSTMVNFEQELINQRIISAAIGRIYWDNNPGASTGLVIFNGNAGNAFNDFINSTAIPSFGNGGLHKLNVQLLDAAGNGNYGPAFSTVVKFDEVLTNTASQKITEGRVWLDNDTPPAIGNFIAVDGNFNDAIENAMQTLIASSLGMHIINVQVRDSANGWGPVFKTAISVENPLSYRNIQITLAQLFWDNDSLSAVNLLAFDGNYSDAIEEALASGVNVPPSGIHTLNVRYRDIAGNWSRNFKTSMVIETPLSSRSIKVTEGEVRIDNNPPAIIIGLNGNFNQALEEMQSFLLSGPLSPGLHTINVRVKGMDNNWGNYFTTTVLMSPCSSTPMPVVSVSGPLEFCIGGSVTLTANSGFNSYTWLRDNIVVGNSSSLPATISGAYTVVVTDTTNCPNASLPINVIVHDPEVTISASSTYCQSTVDSLVASSGFNSYQWSAGSSTAKQLITSGGTYTVTVTDAFGCTDTTSITINALTPPAAPVISANGPLSFCPGSNVTLSSDIINNISWSNGLTIPSFTTDTTGQYVITVTGSNGCTNSTTVSTLRFDSAQATLQVAGPLLYCHDEPSTLIANSSSQYSWSNGETTQTIQPLISGNYTVSVQDSNGCFATSSVVSVTVNPNPTVPVISPNGPLSFCNGGSVTLQSTAGIQHLWSNGSTTNAIVVTQSAVLVDTVINEFGCKSWSLPVTVDVHPSASISANGPTTLCYGDTLTLTAHPDTGVRYDWQNGATTQQVLITSTTSASVIVTETLTGCSDTAYVNVVVNNLPLGTITAAGPTLVCSGSAFTINASGSPHSKFQWFYNGQPITYAVYSGSCSCYLSYNVYGYSYSSTIPGVYSALAIDTLTGCTQFTNSITYAVQVPAVPIISANGGTTLCINANTLLSSGPAVSYLWSTGATTQSVIASAAGLYTVTTTDNLGCTATSVPTLVTFYPTASITASGSSTLCAGESVNLTAHPTGTYLWSNGATTASLTGIDTSGTFTVTVTDVNGCTSVSPPVNVIVNALPSGSISANGSTTVCLGNNVGINATGSPHTIFKWYFNGSPVYYYLTTIQVTGYSFNASSSGNYSALVYDTLTGCSVFTNVIAVQVNPLPQAHIAQLTPVLCFGGNDASLQASGSGTAGPYSFNWNTGSANAIISSLAAGSYIVTVADINGCTDADTFAIGQPTPVAPVLIPQVYTGGYNISCFSGNDGSLSLSAGGTPPYTYSWSTGSTTSTLSSLISGTYSVIVEDVNGCTGMDDIILIGPQPLTIQLTPSLYTGGFNISCANDSTGSVSSSLSGGTGAMSWLWSTGATTSSATNLTAGTYTVTITDSTGCSASNFITLSEPSAITLNSTVSMYNGYNVSCHGSTDGIINLNISGGIPGYHYVWNDSVTTKDRSGLSAGVYTLQVYDTNMCLLTETFTLNEPDSIVVLTTGSLLNCYGDANGTVHAEASGGNGPYTYLWSDGTAGQNAGGLEAGLYQVTVTDSRGCTRVTTAEVQQPQELIGYAFGTYIDCGTQIGLLSVTASGGNSPYTFLWSNGSTAAFQTNQPVGNYSVTVTDAQGCIDTAFAIILNPPDLFAVIPNSNVQCENSTDGTLTVVPSGGVTPYMYLWNTGATTPTINNLAVGTYTVIVTDANGCTAIATANVIPLTLITSTFTPFTSCTGGPNTITVSGNGGLAPYTYLWNTGATTPMISNVTNGVYTITVTDANGCIGIDTTNYTGFVVTASGPTVFCQGDSVILTATGGSNYLWSTGATTASITVHTTGSFTVAVDGCNSGTTINTLVTYCQQNINLKVYIEGFYNPATDSMIAVLDPVNLPLVCDSISVSLVDSASLQTDGVVNDIISTTGNGSFYFGSLLPGRYYYIVVKHRNSIETWSKTPFLFLTPGTNFDFTAP
jgi:hypothetical protein